MGPRMDRDPTGFHSCLGRHPPASAHRRGADHQPRSDGGHLELTQGQIMAESIMMRLAVHVGHEPAHEIVADATRRASAQHVDLSTIIMNDERVMAVMGRKEIEEALNPRAYLGECEAIVDAVTSET